MTGILDLTVLPPSAKGQVYFAADDRMVVLGTHENTSGMPTVDLGIDVMTINPEFKARAPRQNTYVPNITKVKAIDGGVSFGHNYTDMQSQFNLRDLFPKTAPDSKERQTLETQCLPVGMLVSTETDDGYVLIEMRGKNVQVPGQIMPAPAGGWEGVALDKPVLPGKTGENWTAIYGCRVAIDSMWDGLAVEINEESGLSPTEYTAPQLIGIGRDLIVAYNPTALFSTKTSLDIATLKERAKNAPEAGEHERTFGIRADEEGLAAYLLEERDPRNDQLPPFEFKGLNIGTGDTGLLAFGRHRFGAEWLRDTTERMEAKRDLKIRVSDRFPIVDPKAVA